MAAKYTRNVSINLTEEMYQRLKLYQHTCDNATLNGIVREALAKFLDANDELPGTRAYQYRILGRHLAQRIDELERELNYYLISIIDLVNTQLTYHFNHQDANQIPHQTYNTHLELSTLSDTSRYEYLSALIEQLRKENNG